MNFRKALDSFTKELRWKFITFFVIANKNECFVFLIKVGRNEKNKTKT